VVEVALFEIRPLALPVPVVELKMVPAPVTLICIVKLSEAPAARPCTLQWIVSALVPVVSVSVVPEGATGDCTRSKVVELLSVVSASTIEQLPVAPPVFLTLTV